MTGRILVFEGLDGVGKTSLSKAVAAALGAHWLTTPDERTRLVRDTIEDAWAASAESRHLFYAASVIAAGRQAAELAAAGHDVVIDRYWLSTLAYSRAAGTRVDLDALEALIVPADATMWIDLDEPARRQRLGARGATAGDDWSLTVSSELRFLFLRGLDLPIAGRRIEVNARGLERDALLVRALDVLRDVLPRRRPQITTAAHPARHPVPSQAAMEP
jgi:dTMP kinase